MLLHFIHTFGLSRMHDYELAILIAALYAASGFSGVIADMILKDFAFGAVINGFLLFVFLLTSFVAYNELYQQIRYAKPPVLLFSGMGASFTLLLIVSALKNTMNRS